MLIPASSLEQDIGGLWELGIAFPIVNANMERFEFHTSLSSDVEVNESEILVVNTQRRINKNDLVFIGPSSNPYRDINGDLEYYRNRESFRIADVRTIGDNTTIRIAELGDEGSYLKNSYLAGDPITIRSTAEAWKTLLYSTEFPGQNRIGAATLHNTYLQRQDSLDDCKGFAQNIMVIGQVFEDFDGGIVQNIDGKSRSLLNRLGRKKTRMSSWVRIGMSENTANSGNDIDENIAGPKSNDIDEGYGYIDPDTFTDSIDESDLSNTGYMTPYIRSVFYDDPSFESVLSNESYSPGETKVPTANLFLQKILTIPEGVLSAKLIVYSEFSANVRLDEMRFLIDDSIIEHCVGTSKEDEGYYKVDMNPSIGIAIKNKTQIKTFEDLRGIKENIGVGDPNQRFLITAQWKNRPGFFIDDLRALESWYKEGYPVVLRPKMPGILPNLLFCKMSVLSNYRSGSPGTEKADVSVEFEEIAI